MPPLQCLAESEYYAQFGHNENKEDPEFDEDYEDDDYEDDDKDDDCNNADDNNDDTDEGYYFITFSNIIRI